MIIYHGITYYHILKSCLHKITFHAEEDAILLVPNSLQRRCSGLLNCDTEQAVFKNVFFYDWNVNPPGGSKALKVKEISQQMEEWLGKDYLEKVDEWNICSAAYYFGIWAVEMKLPFNWFEEADGLLSQPHFIQNADKVNMVRYTMAEECGNYTGDNACVQKKYVKLSAQLEGFYDPLTEDFNVVELLKTIPAEYQKKLLYFFDVPLNLKFDGNSALMLTQHFSNMKMLTYEEQALLYQMTIDYYMDGCDVFVKWHPTDITDYTYFLDNVTMIEGHFLAELLTLIVDTPLKICGSVESSGTKNLAPICDKVLLFDRDYAIGSFRQNHQYYFCMKLLEELKEYPVKAVGVNQIHLKNMLEFNDANLGREVAYYDTLEEIGEKKQPAVYLIGKRLEESAEEMEQFYESCSEDAVFVFLNEDNENFFWPMKDKVPFVVKEIRIRALEPEVYGKGEGCERIFVFTKNEVAMEKVKHMKYIKKLLQTGVETAVFESTDKDAQIAALKGMLKATEIQLERYIKENAELKGN